MRIGFISPGWPCEKFPNGIVKYVDAITQALNAQGNECYIFSGSIASDNINYNNVIDLSNHITEEKGTLLSGILRKLKIKKKFNNNERHANIIIDCIKKLEHEKRIKLDVFEMEETWGVANEVSKQLDIPVIIKLHGPWFLNGKTCGLDNEINYQKRVDYEGAAINSVAGIIAPSKSVLEEVRSFYNLELHHAVVIPNPAQHAHEKNRWDLSKCKRKQILFVGRFDRHKGGDIAINVFNEVAKVDKNAELFFAGPDVGINVDNKTLFINEYIQRYIKDGEIRKRIKYLGKVTSEMANKLRKESHVTIMASRWENFANTILEPLSIGCPTIATNTGGTPEIIRNNYTGILVDLNDLHGFSSKILDVLNNDNLAIKLSKNSIHDMEERFDADKLALKTSDYYKKIIKEYIK